jgi:energy-coupling factor transport system ATP-binding protein
LLPYTDRVAHLTEHQTVIFGDPQHVLPEMDQVPPIIEIAQHLGISPLPMSTETFPKVNLTPLASQAHEAQDRPQVDQNILLETQNLSTSLGEQQVLNTINFRLHRGEILVLMGPNGAGKTTFLRSILKMIPSSGKILLSGMDVEKLSFAEIIQEIAYLPQNPNDLLFAESVIDELKITLKNHGHPEDWVNIAEFLATFGLTDKGDRYPRDLSVGERQRTALAAITVHGPKIIFLDEPTRGLDYQAKKALSTLFAEWRQQGKAILLVTHDVEFAAQLADRVALLERGHLIFTGSPSIAFTKFPAYQTQTARIFPGLGWITPQDVSLYTDFQI